MQYFVAVVHKDKRSAFSLSFPDLPGVFSAADRWDEIPGAAAEALELWFEDMPPVTPAPFEAVCALPDVIAEIRNGAALIAVPYKAAAEQTRAAAPLACRRMFHSGALPVMLA